MFVFTEGLQHYFLLIAKIAESESQSIFVLAVFGQLLTALTEFVALTMLVPMRILELDAGQKPGRFQDFFKKHIVDLTAESLKAFAFIVMWTVLSLGLGFIGLLLGVYAVYGTLDGFEQKYLYIVLGVFLLPGIYKYLSYFFVQYIVVADPEYISDRRDALKYSATLVKPVVLIVLLAAIAVTGLELLRGHFRELWPLQTSPLAAIGSGLVFYLLALLSHVLLFKFYQLRVKKLG